MKAEEVWEILFAVLALLYLVGIPVAAGFLIAAAGDPFVVVLGAPFWPAVALGWFGYILAGAVL